MRKFLLITFSFLLISSSFASTITPIKPRLNAREIMIPLGNSQRISLMDLSRISIREVELLRGEKMKFFDRLGFKAAQRQLRKEINPDGTVDSKKFIKKIQKASGETGFHLGGFALGFLIGLIGVIIAYFIKDEFKRNRVKWAWIGFAVIFAINLVIILATT